VSAAAKALRDATGCTARPSTSAASSAFAAGTTTARARRARGERDVQNPSHRPHTAVKRQLADHKAAGEGLGRQLLRRRENAERDRQIVRGADFAQIGGRQIDRHAARRHLVAGVPDRRADPLTGLPHRGVGQADDGAQGQAGPDVHLDIDRHRLDADNRGAVDTREHTVSEAIVI
jgi:hypothetical protein